MIIQTVDRSITEHLRRRAVELGFLPDVTLYSSSVDYAAAKEALKITNNLKSIIEVYGIGASETRDDKSDAKLFLDRAGETVGTVGGWPEEFYTKNIDGTWNKYKMPDMTYDVMYELRTITTNTQIDRTMDSIIRRVLGARKYIKLIDANGVDTNIVILVLFKGSADVSGDGYLERVYKYEVNQVWLEEPELLAENIPPLTSYDANIIPTELIVVPEPPPPPPTCNVVFGGIGLTLTNTTLTVGVSLNPISGLSKLVLLIRSSLTGFTPIQEIIVPVDNVLTDFSFDVDMLPYPVEFYVFQVQAYTSCDPLTVATSIESDPPFEWIGLPEVQQIYPINAPQKESIEEWALLTPPIAGYTYQLEFVDGGTSKFVNPNGVQSTQLFIDGSNWYNPRIMWAYSTLDTQTVNPYVRMTIYNSVGSTVCGDVAPDFTNIVVVALNVWLRGAINTGITLNSSGVLETVYGYGTPEYFVPNGATIGNPNPYGNIKMAEGFPTYGNAFIIDVIKLELREEDPNNLGFPSETVVDSAFMWCRQPANYNSYFGNRRCVDFLTGKNDFIQFNADPNIEYFVVVKHRNHLTVSSVKLPLSQMGGATFINLSSNAAMYLQSGGTERYATEPLDLINSFFYMQYGNAHDELGDVGEVNATDTFIVTQDQNQIFNLYVSTDLNLDGYVDTTDVAIVTEGEGALYYSGVPNPSLL